MAEKTFGFLGLFVHRFDHAIRLRILDQRGAVLNAFYLRQRDERMLLALEILFFGQRVIAEFHAVVGENFLDVERVAPRCFQGGRATQEQLPRLI